MSDQTAPADYPACTSEDPNHPGLHCHFVAGHKSDHFALGYSWGDDDIRSLRADLDTARVVTDAAYNKVADLTEQRAELGLALLAAQNELADAEHAEHEQRDAYRATLRARGYVDTADGPAPAPAPAPAPEPVRPGLYEDCPDRDTYATPGGIPAPAGRHHYVPES